MRSIIIAVLALLFVPSVALADKSDAAYKKHIEGLKKRLPSKGFTIVLQKPFVVVGDESPATVRRRSIRTVKWAVDRLKAKYFSKDPDAIIDVWLFKDKRSYRSNIKKLFNDDPDTPYGYYSPTHKALVMNIATGGGTLVHEIVHPFIESNFPDCPAWFNEGLASLYEQCGDKDGQINGYTNWRLAGLQEALRDGGVLTFKELTGTTTREFYKGDRGNNYAQARYLCYYLQERGLLVKFYERFVATAETDPTGYGALKSVLGEKDMQAFQKTTWEPFVLELRYR